MHSARILILGTLAALTAAAQAPRLFYTDLDSGPNTGGERNQGSYVTIYGKGFGEQRGSGTVTVGGGAVANYVSWSDTKVVIQLGAFAASGEIRMQTTGQSNGLPFTVRPGNIFFVSRDGRDIAPNDGSFATPWRTVQKAVETMAPGDITYILDGIGETRPSSREGSVYISGTGGNGNNGAPGQPKALIGYPGARARIGAISSGPCSSAECVEGIRTGWPSSHWTIAGLQLYGNNYGIVIRGRNWRVIGNEFTCPFGSGASACVDASQAETIKLWGNTVRETGYSASSALYHGVYFSTDSNDLDIGWNTISRVQGCRGLQINSTVIDTARATGFNQYNLRIHDNLIEDTQCDGIVLSTVDPSKGAIEIYNNIIVNAGRGPGLPNNAGNFACVYVANFTNNGSPGSGTIEIFHNTMVDCGGFNASSTSSGGVMLVERTPALRARLRNNIIYQRRSPYFGVFDANGRACNTTCQNLFGSNNMFFGLGSAPPSNPVLANTLVLDPFFASLDNRDFRLRATSPARGAGINTGLATDRDGFIRTNQIDLGAYQSSGSSQTGPPPLVVTPDKLETSATAGGGAPPSQRLTLTNNGPVGVEWSASSNQPWLTLGTRQGTVPGGASQQITVTFSAESLPPGVSTATITILAGEGRITVPAQITLATLSTTGPALWTNTPTVTFTANTGADPADQTVRIANFGAPGSTMRWSAQVDQPWLRISPSEGTLTQGPVFAITLSATPPGRLGLFTGNLTITAEGATGSPLNIPVRLAIGSPRISAVVNAASLRPGGLSSRTIISIFGQDIGPDAPAFLQLTPDNRAVTTFNSEVRVLFGDTPAPILYASGTQINAVVPSAAGAARTAEVRVEYLTRRSDPVTVPITITSPAIFTLTGSGTGPGAILNQNGSLNTDENPAEPGSVIAIYLTGLGELDPTPVDGEVITSANLRIRNATQVRVGTQDAGVNYVGAAPGFIAGVYQVNIVVPQGLGPGRHPVRITSAGIASPDTATVAVR